jgi:Domain of unknown function (DUF1851)
MSSGSPKRLRRVAAGDWTHRCDLLIGGLTLFERFLAEHALLPPGQVARPVWSEPRLQAAIGYDELAGSFAGCSFQNGLYRLHDASSGPRAQALIAEAFASFAARAYPFAFDWLGRQFALDEGRKQAGEPLVLILEPGTGLALEVPLPFSTFHDEELVDYHDAALATGFFAAWAQDHAAELPLPTDRCAGYRVPLFLGGKDTVDNLEVVDVDVYWSICGQLRQGTTTLPAGTSINEVSSPE